jgi:hypothetical protein
VNIGPVSLRLRDGAGESGEMLTLGQVAYDRAAYEATAGVVDVPFPPEAAPLLERGHLVLVHDRSGDVLLSEADSIVETDDRGVYLQEGEERQITLRARERGAAVPAGFRVHLEEYDTTDIKGLPGAPTVAEARVVEIPDDVPVEADGTASVTLRARRPGVCVIRFVPMGAPPSTFNPSKDFFANVRVLPEDNYDHVSDEALTYERVFQEVLRYYHVIYPAMSHIIDWSNEDAVRAHAGAILERISKPSWDRFGYMPRTRELSDGKRKLLERWCRLQQEQ